MRFVDVRLDVPAAAAAALGELYGGRLGLELERDVRDAVVVRVGETQLELVAAAGEPFFHFALLVPGDRFRAALDWAATRVELLPDPETGEAVFRSDSWSSEACYFHDPAGNIVELIAHHGIGENRRTGAFAGEELLGLSELGVVCDRRPAAALLERELGLELWTGTLDEPGRLAFVGTRARTLILAPPGRGWVPTGRPAEPHRLDATLSGGPAGEVRIPGSRSTIRRLASIG